MSLRQYLILIPLFLMSLVPSIGSAQDFLNPFEDVRLSWKDIASKNEGPFSLTVVARVCVGQKGGILFYCDELFEFAPRAVSPAEFEIVSPHLQKNSPNFENKELMAIARKHSEKLDNPFVRLSLVLKKNQADGTSAEHLDEQFVDFPPLYEAPEEGETKVEKKVVLTGAGFQTRVVVEIFDRRH